MKQGALSDAGCLFVIQGGRRLRKGENGEYKSFFPLICCPGEIQHTAQLLRYLAPGQAEVH